MHQTSKAIDEYIAGFPSESQRILNGLRSFIHQKVENGTEAMSYGIPTIKRNNKNLVHFAGYKNHIGFYPGSATIAHFGPSFQQYKWSKGTVQFPLNEELPWKLIEDMIVFRLSL